MKRIILVLALFVFLASSSLAESASDDFFNNLSKTWGSFLNLVEETGENVSEWADQSGLTQQAESIFNDITLWAKEAGISDFAEMAEQKLDLIFEESGIKAFTAEASKELQAFMDENGPLVNQWLAEAGDEISKSWDMLIHPEGHSEKELEKAYESVKDSLDKIEEAAESGTTEGGTAGSK